MKCLHSFLRVVLALLFVVSANSAFAAGRSGGKYLCNGCNIIGTLGALMPLTDEALAGLKALEIPTLGNIRVQGDQITLCDGANCVDVTLQNVAAQVWQISSKGVYRDDGKNYKNSANISYIGRPDQGASGTYTVTIMAWGHYEYWDNYGLSDDNVWIYVDTDAEWIFDGYTMTYSRDPDAPNPRNTAQS